MPSPALTPAPLALETAPQIDCGERRVELRQPLESLEGLGLRRRDSALSGHQASVRNLGVPAPVTPRSTRHAQHNLEEPRARTVSALFELLEPAVGYDEDLLSAIVGFGLGHPEPAQVAPNESDVSVVELAKPEGAVFIGGRDSDRAQGRPRLSRRLERHVDRLGLMRVDQGVLHERASSKRPDHPCGAISAPPTPRKTADTFSTISPRKSTPGPTAR